MLLPFGGTKAGVKGSALGLAVELLSAILVGEAPFPSKPDRYGHFFLTIRPDLLTERDDYEAGFSAVVEHITGLKLRDGETGAAWLPGARAMASRRAKLRESAELGEELQKALGG